MIGGDGSKFDAAQRIRAAECVLSPAGREKTNIECHPVDRVVSSIG